MVNSQNIAILSEKVAALEAAIKNAGIELPEVSSSDNGKALQVVDGAWAIGDIIPEVTANPEASATGTLTKLGIGTNVYSIPGIYDDVAVVEGTIAAGDNEFDYPTGFNVSNCVIVSLMYSPGSDRWDTLPNSNYTGVLGSLRASKVVFYNGATAINDKTVRIVLKKIPVTT